MFDIATTGEGQPGVVVLLFGGAADVGIDDRQLGANGADLLHEPKHVRRVQVVINPQAQHHIKLAVALHRQVAHVVAVKVDVAQAQAFFHKARLGQVSLAPFNAHHLCALHGQLQAIHPLQTSQIQNPQPFHRTAAPVHDNLGHAAQLWFRGGRLGSDRIATVG